MGISSNIAITSSIVGVIRHHRYHMDGFLLKSVDEKKISVFQRRSFFSWSGRNGRMISSNELHT